MKVTRTEIEQVRLHLAPCRICINLETSEEARLFWLLISNNVTVPEALVRNAYLKRDEQEKMEEFMEQICKGVRNNEPSLCIS